MVRVGLAVAGAALVLLGGVALTWGSSDDAETRVSPLGEVDRIELVEGSGDVDVSYAPTARAEVRQEIHRWWGGGWWDGGQVRYEVRDGRLALDTDCGGGCTVNYSVTLPTEAPVNGTLGSGSLAVDGARSVDTDASSGSVDIRDVAGPVNARTGSGDIRMRGIGGNVVARTSSGEIEGTGLGGGNIFARTGSGELELRLDEANSVDLESGSGDLELAVPPSPYRVDSNTGSGDMEIDAEIADARDPNAPRELKVSTGSGDAEVRSR